MDFGMARSLESTGLTQTGAMMGTPAYMSPEQAEGRTADARSDIFAIGIILYEMLTGVVPFKADTILATLLKRTQGPPVAPRDLNATLPQGINDVVLKCLAVDPAQRYQSASDLLRELDALSGGQQPASTLSPVTLPPAFVPSARRPKRWILAGAAILLLAVIAGGAAVWSNLRGRPVNAGKPVSVLVADFENATGDSIFNGTLEPMFTLALEGAPFISAVRRDTAMQAAREVQPNAAILTESLARLVAVRQGIAVVVVGSVRQSGTFVIRVRALDGATGREIAQRETTASDKEGVLKTVGKLAARIRTALGDATPESKQIAAAETFTAGSLEAAQAYGEAQAQRFAGKTEAAANSYLKAISLDPNFGSAYASLAAVSNNLGQRDKAVKLYQEALTHIERMTDREKYRTRGGYYLVTMDPQKAGDEFAALVRLFPADYMGYSSLAYADYLRHDMRSALEAARHALELYPNNVPYRNNLALYALYAGQFDVAVKESSASIGGNPGYIKGYITLAAAQLGDGHPDQAAQTYDRLRGVSALGASFASSGKADLALYQGREKDALTELESGIAGDVENKNPTAAAKKLLAMAEALLLLGRKAQAIESVDRAVKLAKEDVLFPAARLYVQAGQDGKASGLAADLGRKFEPLPQALSKVIAGEIELEHGRPREAIALLQASVAQSDMWLARFDLGRAYVAADAFPQADSEFDLCLRRRGEATDGYMNDEQTSHFLPPVYYYLGRVREGLRSSGAVDSYKRFLAFKDAASQDPMVLDARRRAPVN
jgi:tetratricopeptide (TPR) repeat protein